MQGAAVLRESAVERGQCGDCGMMGKAVKFIGNYLNV